MMFNTVVVPLSASGIIELIRRNNNAKRPKIRFLHGGVEFTLSVADSKARYPGTINVVAGQVFYGRIHLDGRYEYRAGDFISAKKQAAVVATMNEIAKDPAKAAAEFGKQTGRCCFCYLPLTDHRSLTVGYGAICAKHYRLPWDASKLETALLVTPLTDEQAFG